MMKKRGLGRGLEVLLGEAIDPGAKSDKSGEVRDLLLEQLQRGKYQPRKVMHESELKELAESIKVQGIMQPLLVRSIGNSQYEIIAGERRFRAAAMVGLKSVPVLIRDVDDKAAAAMALIENMQREDLNPLEESEGLARLISEFGFTHEQAAQVVGKSRSAVSNLLRLSQLSKTVQNLLMSGEIDMGHARALIPLSGAMQVGLAQRVAAQGLSVRETEKLANALLNASVKQSDIKKVVKKGVRNDPDLTRLQNQMSDLIGLAVDIKTKTKGGEIKIKFSHADELQSLFNKLGLV